MFVRTTNFVSTRRKGAVVILAITTGTTKELEGIINHFKAHENGKVMIEGVKYEGYIPPHGTFARQMP